MLKFKKLQNKVLLVTIELVALIMITASLRWIVTSKIRIGYTWIYVESNGPNIDSNSTFERCGSIKIKGINPIDSTHINGKEGEKW
jgi:hypothetical protein